MKWPVFDAGWAPWDLSLGIHYRPRYGYNDIQVHLPFCYVSISFPRRRRRKGGGK